MVNGEDGTLGRREEEEEEKSWLWERRQRLVLSDIRFNRSLISLNSSILPWGWDKEEKRRWEMFGWLHRSNKMLYAELVIPYSTLKSTISNSHIFSNGDINFPNFLLSTFFSVIYGSYLLAFAPLGCWASLFPFSALFSTKRPHCALFSRVLSASILCILTMDSWLLIFRILKELRLDSRGAMRFPSLSDVLKPQIWLDWCSSSDNGTEGCRSCLACWWRICYWV